jgi:hydrogenase nickel incorporation protein HypA/HybF
MHELAVTESILEICLRHANNAQAQQVTHVYLVIGQLSSIVDDSVQFYWEMISRDTICSGAVLHFNRIAARMHCNECDQEFELANRLSPCPHCGSYNLKIIAGEEFFIESIEIEK